MLSLAITILSFVVAAVSAAFGIAANQRSFRLGQQMAKISSEREQLRRGVRYEALYKLMAVWQLIDDFESLVWMTAKEKRANKDMAIRFLEERFSELNEVHTRPSFHLLQQALDSFHRGEPIDKDVLQSVLKGDTSLSESATDRYFEVFRDSVGLSIDALESNLWISTADVISRLRAARWSSPDDKYHLQEEFGEDGALLLHVLLRYFEEVELLNRLLRWAEAGIISHLDTIWQESEMRNTAERQ